MAILATLWYSSEQLPSILQAKSGKAPRRKPTQQVRPWSRLAPVFFRTRFRKNSFSCGTFLLLKSCNEPFSLGRTDISRKVQSEERNLSFHSGKLCKYDVLIVRQIHRICFLSRIVPRPVSRAKLGFDLLIVFIAMTTKIPRGALPYF